MPGVQNQLKVTDGAGGYRPGKLKILRTTMNVSESASALVKDLDSEAFWAVPSHGGPLGCDGAEWIIEGVRDGTYHVVDRWCPKGRICTLGTRFLRVAGFDPKEDR